MPDEQLNELNAEIVQLLRAEGSAIPSTAQVGGRLALRPCYVNAATTLAEVDELADVVVRIGDRLIADR